MSSRRRQFETSEWFAEITDQIRGCAGGAALVAVDQELGGIQRLHDLVPPLPTPAEARDADPTDIETAAAGLADACSGLGVNVVLSPIVDVLDGSNPWLEGRTVSTDAGDVARISADFVRGLQSSGRVAATAKHFPGHPHVALDPAVSGDSIVEAGRSELTPSLEAFRSVIGAGVKVVMTGPTLVPAIDAKRAASRSARTVELLRTVYGFEGVVLSDDLDSPGILRGGTLSEAAIDALAAGVDWLLVAGTPDLPDLVAAVAAAAESGAIPARRLHDAADLVRQLTDEIGSAS